MTKLIIILTALGVPLIFLPQVQLTFELPKAMFFRLGTILAILSATIFFIKNGKFFWTKINKKLWIFLGLYIIFSILSAIFGISPHTSIFGSYERQQGLLQLIGYVILFLITISAFSSDKDKKTLPEFIEVISLVSFFIATLAVLQKFLPVLTSIWDTDILVDRTIIGTLGNPNFLASYLVMTIPFFFFNFKNSKEKLIKLFWIFAIFISLTAIILSASRSALLGLSAGLLFYGIIKNKKLLIIPLIFTIIILFANIFAEKSFIKNTYFLERLTIKEESLSSIKSRLNIWPGTIEAIKERPILGYGQENFEEVFLKYKPKELFKTERFLDTTDRAHNEILDTAISSGILGLISYLTFLTCLIYIAVRAKSDFLMAASTGIISLFACNMFSFSTTTNYVIWWVLAALIVVSSGKKLEIKIPISLGKFTKIISILVIFALAIITIYSMSIKPLIADYYYDKAKNTAFADSSESFAKFEKAVYFNPNEPKYSLMAADYFVILAKYTKDETSKIELIKKADSFMQSAEKILNKNSVEILYMSAKIDVLKQNYASAIAKFEKAYEKAQTSPDILLNYARALSDAQKYKESLEMYEKYLNLSDIWKSTKFSTEEEKTKFRLFFKHAYQFRSAMKEASQVATLAKEEEKSKYYKDAKDEVNKVLDEFQKQHDIMMQDLTN
ncbi:MAG: O-antigen ligase family protein [Candidatus Gracilibacteria bacterium]|jgi:O-antigen ligase